MDLHRAASYRELIASGAAQPRSQESSHSDKPAGRVIFQRTQGRLDALIERASDFRSRLNGHGGSMARGVAAYFEALRQRLTNVQAKFGQYKSSMLAARVVPQQPKIALPAGGDVERIRAFLFNPAYQSLRDQRMPEIHEKKMTESLQFLQALQSLRQHPTLELASSIKVQYIDGLNEEFDFSTVTADQFGRDLQASAVNITAEQQQKFNGDYSHLLACVDKGEPMSQADVLKAFHGIEAHIAHLLLRNLGM